MLVLAVGTTFFYYRGWLAPTQRMVLHLPRPFIYIFRSAARPIKTFFANAYNLREIARENVVLKEDLLQLRNRQVLFDQLSLENESLRKDLQFSKTGKLVLVPCTVMGRSSSGLAETMSINCGTKEGAEVGRAVVSKGYLIGKISYAAENFSAVQLISNSGFSVDAKLSHTGQLAIVRGSFNSGLVLEQVSQDEPLEKGMLVVTAGLNNRTAKNILIGEIDELLSSPNDLFKKASVVNPIDFSNLDFVFLVK